MTRNIIIKCKFLSPPPVRPGRPHMVDIILIDEVIDDALSA